MAYPPPIPKKSIPPPLPPRTPDMLSSQQSSSLPRGVSPYPPSLPPRAVPNTSRLSSSLKRPVPMQRRPVSAGNDPEIAPPLPPKPQGLTKRQVSYPNTLDGRISYDTIPLPMDELTKNFTKNIPSCVAVKCAASDSGTLKEGDLLNLHFTKDTRVVNTLSISGMNVMVPVNSPMLCSVLYDPVDDIDRALKGYIFGSGSLLLSASPLPHFIGVLRGSKQTKTSSLFSNGEILVVKELSDGKQLKCLSIPSGEKKYIHQSTNASFTTDPNQLKTYLSVVMKHLDFQAKVLFYPQNATLQQSMRSPYTILDAGLHKSVIATFFSDQKLQSGEETQHILEILQHAPVKFDLIELSRTERRELIRKSKKIFETFNPSCVSEIVANVPPAVSSCQTLLFKMVEQIHGSTIKEEKVMVHQAPITGIRPKHFPFSAPTQSAKQDTRYTPPTGMSSNTATINARQTHCYPDQRNNFDMFPSTEIEDPYSLTPGNFNDERDIPVDDIYDDFRNSEMQIADLRVKEVLLILEKLGLNQYKDVFSQERITGSMLLQLDEDILKNELGMTSRLHRIKLMDVIKGQQSINELLH